MSWRGLPAHAMRPKLRCQAPGKTLHCGARHAEAAHKRKGHACRRGSDHHDHARPLLGAENETCKISDNGPKSLIIIDL
jgi:hypothetical protein